MTERPMTVDPDREVPQEELDALIAIETAERLAVRAHGLIGKGDPESLRQASALLVALTEITTTRTCTAVKRQSLSDAIASTARQRVREIVDTVVGTSPTHIPAARLVELRQQGLAAERADGPFVDPRMLYRCEQVLAKRGQRWAEAILSRSMAKRSIAFPNKPWLNPGDDHTLVLADVEEDRAAFDGITGGQA